MYPRSFELILNFPQLGENPSSIEKLLLLHQEDLEIDMILTIKSSLHETMFQGNLNPRHINGWDLLFYLVIVLILTPLKVYCTWKLISLSTDNPNHFKKLSTISVLLIFAWDTSLSRNYLTTVNDQFTDLLTGFLRTIDHLSILSETILCGVIWS